MSDEVAARAFLDGGGPMLPAPVGRPSDYNEDVATRICEAIADGMSLRKVAKLDGFPGRSVVFDWLAAQPEFAKAYAVAMDWRTENRADEIIEIADDRSNDYLTDGPPDGQGIATKIINKHAIDRARLQINTRLRLMMSEKPRKYAAQATEVMPPPANVGTGRPGDSAKLIGESSADDGAIAFIEWKQRLGR